MPITGGLAGPTRRWWRPIVLNNLYALAMLAFPCKYGTVSGCTNLLLCLCYKICNLFPHFDICHRGEICPSLQYWLPSDWWYIPEVGWPLQHWSWREKGSFCPAIGEKVSLQLEEEIWADGIAVVKGKLGQPVWWKGYAAWRAWDQCSCWAQLDSGCPELPFALIILPWEDMAPTCLGACTCLPAQYKLESLNILWHLQASTPEKQGISASL